MVFDIGDSFIPAFDEDSGNYYGIIGSQDWRLEDDGLYPGAWWRSNVGGQCSIDLTEENSPVICGDISNTVGWNGVRTFTARPSEFACSWSPNPALSASPNPAPSHSWVSACSEWDCPDADVKSKPNMIQEASPSAGFSLP